MPAQAGIHYCLVLENETGNPQGFSVDTRAGLNGPRLGGRGDKKKKGTEGYCLIPPPPFLLT